MRARLFAATLAATAAVALMLVIDARRFHLNEATGHVVWGGICLVALALFALETVVLRLLDTTPQSVADEVIEALRARASRRAD